MGKEPESSQACSESRKDSFLKFELMTGYQTDKRSPAADFIPLFPFTSAFRNVPDSLLP